MRSARYCAVSPLNTNTSDSARDIGSSSGCPNQVAISGAPANSRMANPTPMAVFTKNSASRCERLSVGARTAACDSPKSRNTSPNAMTTITIASRP